MKKQFILGQKIEYVLKTDISSEEVVRKFSQIIWLHDQLGKEFAGLKLPDAPVRDLVSISNFFKQLLGVAEIANSYLLAFFTSCSSSEKFNEYVSHKATPFNHSVFLKSLLLDSVTVKEKDLKDLDERAAELKDIDQLNSADFMMFSESIFKTSQNFLQNFSELNRHVEDIKRLLNELSGKFGSMAEIFGVLSLQAKKLNFAKSQFPLFSTSNINLDLAFAKSKILFYNTSFVTRSSDHEASKELLELRIRQVRGKAD